MVIVAPAIVIVHGDRDSILDHSFRLPFQTVNHTHNATGCTSFLPVVSGHEAHGSTVPHLPHRFKRATVFLNTFWSGSFRALHPLQVVCFGGTQQHPLELVCPNGQTRTPEGLQSTTYSRLTNGSCLSLWFAFSLSAAPNTRAHTHTHTPHHKPIEPIFFVVVRSAFSTLPFERSCSRPAIFEGRGEVKWITERPAPVAQSTQRYFA